ncbi:hypothetical protein D9758_006846 [Tetrapyrgos nigripes]|uniref:Protein kinase domain-containing protein n=1 Tax=Tetrapyrgos nigripes TaxID=182062 RepID=A0A8H5FU20_9AGAR|nr:hypothetical protein D9758_006846 [Tetrapyrgos nigripes]
MSSFNLPPIVIPALYSPLSPSEPGYSSPAESDASPLLTPCFPDQHDHLVVYKPQSPCSERHSVLCSVPHKDTKENRVPSQSSSFGSSSPSSFRHVSLDSDAFPTSPAPLSPLTSHVHAYSFMQAQRSPSSPSKHKARNTYPLYNASSLRAPVAPFNLNSTLYSAHFPEGHRLNSHFVRQYDLQDELGSGGYGFVMTARHRLDRHEVAVKFIIKAKVPDHAWMVHDVYGKLPTEVMLLSVIEHENIVKCLDLFEDCLYFYLVPFSPTPVTNPSLTPIQVQELHGSPWDRNSTFDKVAVSHPCTSPPTSTPSLTPSASLDSISSLVPSIPLQLSDRPLGVKNFRIPKSPSTLQPPRPKFVRRPSHDLFECIEQSEHKHLTQDQARYVFSQIVDAVCYLDEQGVAHRDIKDENIVIDRDLKVKLIDFGSATFVDPAEERPFYTLFYGTTAYAASEILQKKPYQAAPAEVWTLGVLLSYLLTGTSPFPTVKHAVTGRIVLPDNQCVSDAAMDLMHACLDPDPEKRITVSQVKRHHWLNQD